MLRGRDQDDTEARAFRYLAGICGRTAADAMPTSDAPPDPDLSDLMPALIDRHRISTRAIGAVACAVHPHDPVIAEGLSRTARDRRLGALAKARRMATISDALSKAGIRHVGIKGPVLAQQIYGDVAARDSKDLDLLIDPAAMVRATAVLAAIGVEDIAGDDAAHGQFANKHRAFVGDGIEIEVHARLFDIEALMPLSFEQVWRRRDAVMIGGIAVPALSMVDTLAYLCAHGGQHLWFRLKWLEDIARIVTIADPAVIEAARMSARETGAEMLVVGALQLVDDVFAIRWDTDIRTTRTSRALVRLSKAALAAPADHASAPPLGAILRKLPVLFGMARGWRYRYGLARMLMLMPRGFDATALPRGLGWLRVPLRPVMLLRDRWTDR